MSRVVLFTSMWASKLQTKGEQITRKGGWRVGENKGVGKGIYSDTFRHGIVNCKGARQRKMSDRNCVGEAMIEMQMKWLFVNEEYQMLICARKLCGIGMELGGVEKHLIKRHEVKSHLGLLPDQRSRFS